MDRDLQRRRIADALERFPATVPVREHQRRFVARCADLFALRDPVLDVGCGFRSNEPELCRLGLRDYYTTDINPAHQPDFLLSADNMDCFADQLFGTVVCTELLEHVPEPVSVVRELGRVLQVGGYCIVTVPFWVPVHRKPPFQEDFWRFTPDGILLLLSEMKLVMLELHGPADRPEGIFGLWRKALKPN